MNTAFWSELEKTYFAVIKYEVMRKDKLFEHIRIFNDKVFGDTVRMFYGKEIILPLKTISIDIQIPEVYVERTDKRLAMSMIADSIDRAVYNCVSAMKKMLCEAIRTICEIDTEDLLILTYLRDNISKFEEPIELQQLADWQWTKDIAVKVDKVYLKSLVKYCNFVLDGKLVTAIKRHFEHNTVKPEQAPETAKGNDTIKLLTEAFNKLQSKCGDHFEWIDFGGVVEPMLTSYDLVECCNELLEEYKNSV